ncbi:MAG: hypothetical protein WD139_13625 [Balneolaceae bacterium]
MDAVHLHLIVNHVSLFITIFAFPVLIWGMYRKNESFFSLAMIGLIFAGLFSLIAMLSGEAAEEIAENISGISGTLIHDHEEMAELSNWISLLLSVGAATALFIQKKKPAFQRSFGWTLVVLTFVSAGLISYTAYLGGLIRHTEIHTAETIDHEIKKELIQAEVTSFSTSNEQYDGNNKT